MSDIVTFKLLNFPFFIQKIKLKTLLYILMVSNAESAFFKFDGSFINLGAN